MENEKGFYVALGEENNNLMPDQIEKSLALYKEENFMQKIWSKLKKIFKRS